jgi:hypothetical protein
VIRAYASKTSLKIHLLHVHCKLVLFTSVLCCYKDCATALLDKTLAGGVRMIWPEVDTLMVMMMMMTMSHLVAKIAETVKKKFVGKRCRRGCSLSK